MPENFTAIARQITLIKRLRAGKELDGLPGRSNTAARLALQPERIYPAGEPLNVGQATIMSNLQQVFARFQGKLAKFRSRPRVRITLYSGTIELDTIDRNINQLLSVKLAQAHNSQTPSIHEVANDSNKVLSAIKALFPAPMVTAVANMYYDNPTIQTNREK